MMQGNKYIYQINDTKNKSNIKNDTRKSFIKKEVAFDVGLCWKDSRREGLEAERMTPGHCLETCEASTSEKYVYAGE